MVTSLLFPLATLRSEYAMKPAPTPFVIEYVSGITNRVRSTAKPTAKSTLPILLRSRIGNVDFAVGFAVLLTLFVMPLTYSITNGVGAGFIAYSLLKVAGGKSKDVSLWLWVATIAFAIYFADPWLRQFIPK